MNLKAEFEKIRTGFTGALEFDFPLSKIAYYKIGGPALVLATPKSFSDLVKLKKAIKATKIPYFFLGWGSNLLFSDDGFQGVVIRMKHLFTHVEVEGSNVLKLGASLGASQLLRKASEQGYGGLAHLTGIPGSVGGMVAMNAGTHSGEMKDVLIKSEFVNFDDDAELQLKEKIHTPSDFSYRHNHFLTSGDLITHAYVHFEKSDCETIRTEIEGLYARRKATQPVDLPSCGSVFMNPKIAGLHAWQIIDQLGLRGHQIGGAQISLKHSNFIVNLGSARATDVKMLIELVKTRAKLEMNVDLQEEVRILS